MIILGIISINSQQHILASTGWESSRVICSTLLIGGHTTAFPSSPTSSCIALANASWFNLDRFCVYVQNRLMSDKFLFRSVRPVFFKDCSCLCGFHLLDSSTYCIFHSCIELFRVVSLYSHLLLIHNCCSWPILHI